MPVATEVLYWIISSIAAWAAVRNWSAFMLAVVVGGGFGDGDRFVVVEAKVRVVA